MKREQSHWDLQWNWNLVLKSALCDVLTASEHCLYAALYFWQLSDTFFRCTYFNVFQRTVSRTLVFVELWAVMFWSQVQTLWTNVQECNTSICHDIHAEHTLERIWCGHVTPAKNISANRRLTFLCLSNPHLMMYFLRGIALFWWNYLGWLFFRWINHENVWNY